MAGKGGRKYARDKAGRFASTGATARGARLKGKGAAGGKAQGRAGGNLDAKDVGRKSSGPSGTIGGSARARTRAVADRKGISTTKARNMMDASKGARKGAKTRSASSAAADKAARQKTFGSKAKPNAVKAEYKKRASMVRENSRRAAGVKAAMPNNKEVQAVTNKQARSAKASLTRLVNSRGAKKRKK